MRPTNPRPDFGDDSIVTKRDLKRILGINGNSLNRMIRDGFIDPPFDLCGRLVWEFRSVKKLVVGGDGVTGKPSSPGLGERLMGKYLLTADEVGEAMSMGPKAIWYRVRRNEFPAPIGDREHARWRASDVIAYMESKQSQPEPEETYGIVQPEATGSLVVPPELAGLAGQLQEFDLRKDPVVYFLVLSGRVVYVGSSVRLPLRLLGHRGKEFDRVLYIRVEESRMLAVEMEMIRLLRPPLNIAGNCGWRQDEEDRAEAN